MKKFLEKAPLFIAILVALSIAILARFLVPIVLPKPEKELMELQVPDIKLIANEDMQSQEYVEVAIIGVDMPMNTILSTEHISWSQWPKSALAATYVVREEGNITANADEYAKSIGQYASHNIPAGVPLLPNMFGERIVTQEEMRTRFEDEQKEMERVQKQKRQEESFNIRPGMRAVTVPISKQSANSAMIMKIGDIVDVMYIKNIGDYNAPRRSECVQYNAVRILAIDGQCQYEEQEDDQTNEQKHPARQHKNSIFGSESQSVPMNVTLELASHQVREMMPHVQSEGVVIILRPAMDGEEEFAAASDAPTDNDVHVHQDVAVIDQSMSSESMLDVMRVLRPQPEVQSISENNWSALHDMMKVLRYDSASSSVDNPQVLGYVREHTEGEENVQSSEYQADYRRQGSVANTSGQSNPEIANLIFCARGTDGTSLSFDSRGRLVDSTSVSTGGSSGGSIK